MQRVILTVDPPRLEEGYCFIRGEEKKHSTKKPHQTIKKAQSITNYSN